MSENPSIYEFPEFVQQHTYKLSRLYPLANMCTWTLVLLVCGVVLFFVTALVPKLSHLKEGLDVIWALPLIGLVYAWVWLSSSLPRYAVRQEDVSYYCGVFFRRIVIQPIVRLQHIEISRGVIERLFGLATLKLYSAGGAHHAVVIPGLHYHVAQSLREHITSSRSLKNGQ